MALDHANRAARLCSMLYVVDVISSVSKEPTPARRTFEIPLAISQNATSAELPGRVRPRQNRIDLHRAERTGSQGDILSGTETGNFSSLFPIPLTSALSSSSFYAAFTTPTP